MNAAESLMLHGVAGVCPDCGDERILVLVERGEYCCTDCDAAVVVIDVVTPSYRSAAARAS